jgi:hypothetical protein
MKEPTFKPRGTPLSVEELTKQIRLTRQAFDTAIATANPKLRAFLKAKVRR